MSKTDERLLLPKNLMAKAFGISVTAFDKWEIAPYEKRGREQLYSLIEVIEYRLNRDNKNTLSLQKERARLASAQANKTEIEVKILQGNVFKAEHVEAAWTSMLSACRSKFLSIPTKLASVLSIEKDAQKIEQILRITISEGLQELSDYDPKQYNKSVSEALNEDDVAASDLVS